MSFLELYYPQVDAGGSKGEKTLPYLVRFSGCMDLMAAAQDRLRADGFDCVCSGNTNVLLINLELKRFGVLPKPVHTSCRDGYEYSPEEFYNQVYVPWKAHGGTSTT